MKRVYICSPFSGDVNQNVLYARAAMRHCLMKGEAPYAPHLLYTQPQVLNDSMDEERKIGVKAGHAYLQRSVRTKAAGGEDIDPGCELVVVYYDRGISKGMMEDMAVAAEAGVPLEFRSLKKSDEDLWRYMGFEGKEAQERGITAMWLDEQDRVEAGE